MIITILFLLSCFNKNISRINENIYKINTPNSEKDDLIDLLEKYIELKNQDNDDSKSKIEILKNQILEFLKNNKFLSHYYDVGSHIYEILAHNEIVEKLKNIKIYLKKEGIELKEEFECLGLNHKKPEIIKLLMYINKNFSLKERILIKDLKNINSFKKLSSLIFKKIKNLETFELIENANEQRSILPKNNWLEYILKFKGIEQEKKIIYINSLIEDFNIDTNEENWRGENILHCSCFEDIGVEIIDLLVQKGVNVNKKEKILGFTPIFFAIKKGKFEIVKYFLENKDKLNINIFEKDYNERTFLHHAAISLNELRTYLKDKNDTSKENKKNYYFIINYLIRKIFEIVNSNLMKEIEKKDHYNKTFYNYFTYESKRGFKKYFSFDHFLLSYCSHFFTAEILQHILKDKKVEFEDEDNFVIAGEKTNFSYLVDIENYLLLDYIFKKRDGKINLKSLSSKLLDWIFQTSNWINPIILNILLKFNEEDISSFPRRESEQSVIYPLSLTIIQDNYEAFKMILENTSDINYLNTNKGEFTNEDLGTTPLNETIKYYKLNMFNLILEREDLDINKQDKIGYTAAHYACEFDRIEILKALIKRDIDLKIKNGGGETPKDIARKKRNKNILKVLDSEILEVEYEDVSTYYEKCAKKIKDKDSEINDEREKYYYQDEVDMEEKYYQKIPLIYYIMRGDFETFQRELNSENSNSYYIRYLGVEKQTLLHLAIKLKKENFVRLLIEKGANPLEEKRSLDLFDSNQDFASKYRGNCVYEAIKTADLENINILKILLDKIKSVKSIKKMRFEYLRYSLELDKKEIFKEILEFLNFNDKKLCLEEILISYINDADKEKLSFILNSFHKELEIKDEILKYLEITIDKFKAGDSEKVLRENLLAIVKVFLEDKILDIKEELIFKIVNTNFLPLIIFFKDSGTNFNLIFKKKNLKYLEDIDQSTFEYLLKNSNVNKNKLFIAICSNNYLNLLEHIINLKEIKNFEKILISSIEKRNIEVIKNILSKKLIKINEVMEENGETPLTLAVKFNSLKVIKFLLNQEELNVNIKNREGKTALLVSILDSFNCLERDLIIRKLLNSGADTSVRYGAGCNILMLAIMKCSISIVKEILNKDVRINDQNLFGETALALLIKDLNINSEKKLKIIKKLLEKEGIDLDIKDKKGNDVFKLSQELEESEFKIELTNLLQLKKRQ